MTFIVKKLKKCPKCGNTQAPKGKSFKCNSCNCLRVNKGIKNHFVLRDKFLDDDFIDNFDKCDDYSDSARKIKRAINNHKNDNQNNEVSV